MKYCSKCGKELRDDELFCSGCGNPVNAASQQPIQAQQPIYGRQTIQVQQPVQGQVNTEYLLSQLSEKVKINGIIWLVIGALQIFAGIFAYWPILIVGLLNIVSAIMDINYSKTVFQNPTGIVAKFEPLVGPIITLIYNLVVGGVVGVIGSVYYFAVIRQFVLNNKSGFARIEADFKNRNAVNSIGNADESKTKDDHEEIIITEEKQ